MPIRVLSITLLVFLALSTSLVMTIGIKDEQLKQVPLSGWRKKLRGSLRFFGRAIAFCFGFHHIKKNGQRSTSMKYFLKYFVFSIMRIINNLRLKKKETKLPYL